MICEQAQRLASEALDSPLDAATEQALDEHTSGCETCSAFRGNVHALRQRLRLQPADGVPDIAGNVAARLRAEGGVPRQAPGWHDTMRVAAVFVLAVIAGAVVVGIRGPAAVRAESLSVRLLSDQASVSTLTADLTVVERGWHRDVPLRRYTGRLTYRAPESLVVRLRDTTDYPSPAWPRNDVEYVVADEVASSAGLRPCPRTLQPSCSGQPATTTTRDRPPFEAADPVPLDLVMPVASLGEDSAPRPLGQRTVAGEEHVGVAVTAAQVEPLLTGITGVGNWRAVHPADEAHVWVDDSSLTLRSVAVFAAQDTDRRRWAVGEQYDDGPGEPLLEITLRGVRTNGDIDAAALSGPQRDGFETTAGFVEGPASIVPTPGWLPDGVAAHRQGAQGDTEMASWTDGRAWLRVAATDAWSGGRLFGDLGEVVRRVPLAAGGVAYVGSSGRTIGIHGDKVDVAVTGSFDAATLMRVAGSLGVAGEAVPPHWRESATTSASAAARSTGVLGLPDLAGFGPPAARVEGRTVTFAVAGAGGRGFVVVQRPGTVLSPPLDAHVIGVRVRGQEGRYTLGRGELEWVEDGRVVIVMRSETVGLRELLALAELLETRP